jgi:hypothetical protein
MFLCGYAFAAECEDGVAVLVKPFRKSGKGIGELSVDGEELFILLRGEGAVFIGGKVNAL